ncbi:phosphodiester glycosidase family protein [Paenibacillus filicis]|uniref:Phosphodiester glycosidase family protein n=1 Tax=Paenibacillus gyeongsangnamensis TaxID=3388067 RepID=A0ABT4Q5B6_9BACL|nr:phosphodiester glycosidase family protein [Paenibacillus filicis]MCZ8512009.1 phosphodiester glycosidase family protein [Paenibacillus filicis]
MSANLSSRPQVQTASKPKRKPAAKSKKRRSSFGVTLFFYTVFVLLIFGTFFSGWFFLTESGSNLRFMLADTLIATQHRDWAKYLIGSDELEKRVNSYWAQFDRYAEVKDKPIVHVESKPVVAQPEVRKPPVEVEPISGNNFKGYLLSVHDPKMLRIAVPGKVGKGEKVSSMVQRLGAVAGVNAGGFVDPEWMGNGFQPTGLVMSGGKLFYNDGGMNTPNHMVGIDKDGRMVAGKYTPNELIKMGVQDAVTFAPKFIVNGVGMIKNQADGWGIAPRTCMAQKEDGTIMFAIIDGRQPGYSIGATLYDIQKIFLEHGAVTAANLDGGSSTVLVKDNKIVNKPSSEYGERYLPTAWLVFDDPKKADQIKNIWEGLDPSKIDPSKW